MLQHGLNRFSGIRIQALAWAPICHWHWSNSGQILWHGNHFTILRDIIPECHVLKRKTLKLLIAKKLSR